MSGTRQLHIRLDAADQVADYLAVRTALGIRRDADLIRYLLWKEARELRIDRRARERLAILRARAGGEISGDKGLDPLPDPA
jgi:hypothetical protein